VQEGRQSNVDYKKAIANADFHYSLHPALFEHMLGETVGYSEGLWTADTKSLTASKYNNYEYICQKLRLAPGLQVLEVGPGWGYLPIFMVKRYGVDVTVYNPVRRQNDYMCERFRRHGVADKINLIAVIIAPSRASAAASIVSYRSASTSTPAIACANTSCGRVRSPTR